MNVKICYKVWVYVNSYTFLVLFIYGIASTFGLFHSNVDGDVNTDVAKWNILINDTNISDGVTDKFVINDLAYSDTTNKKPGTIAPGTSGTFSLTLDATDTQVSVIYTIEVDESKFGNEMLKIAKVEKVAGSGDFQEVTDGVYQGIIPYNAKSKVTIDFTITWINDEANNEIDSEIGTRENPDLEIPVVVTATQYVS